MKKPIAIAAVAVCIVVALVVGVGVAHAKPHLYDIDPAEITSITLSNGNAKLTKMTITDRDEIEKIVKLANGFTYSSFEKIGSTTGEGYSVWLETETGGTRFEFWESGIKVRDPESDEGGSILYYCEDGYFDELIALSLTATEPINS